MIPLLDRYVTRELVGPLLFGLAMFSTLLVVALALMPSVTLVSRGADVGLVLKLAFMEWLMLLPFVLPMALLLGTLLAFGRLSSDSEVVALQAAGTPLLRIGLAALLIGGLLSITSLVLTERVVPPAAREASRLEIAIQAAVRGGVEREMARDRPFVYHDVERGRLRSVVVARRLDPDLGRMDDVDFLQYESGRVSRLIHAERAEWQEATRWVFFNGVAKDLGDGILPGQREQRFEQLRVELHRTPREIRAARKHPQQMTYYELQEHLAGMREQGTPQASLRELEVELHRKLADPLICLVFALIGTPLGIRRQRGGPAVGLGLSILIVFSFYLLWSTARVLGENGTVAPFLASWLANGVGLLIGAGLLWRAAR